MKLHLKRESKFPLSRKQFLHIQCVLSASVQDLYGPIIKNEQKHHPSRGVVRIITGAASILFLQKDIQRGKGEKKSGRR